MPAITDWPKILKGLLYSSSSGNLKITKPRHSNRADVAHGCNKSLIVLGYDLSLIKRNLIVIKSLEIDRSSGWEILDPKIFWWLSRSKNRLVGNVVKPRNLWLGNVEIKYVVWEISKPNTYDWEISRPGTFADWKCSDCSVICFHLSIIYGS